MTAFKNPAGEKVSPRLRIIYALSFLLSAFIGALIFSWSTSPLYSDVGYDSAMFQTIGKYWTEGVLPYIGLFDHKGPVIFFINAIGYALCGRTGVFILQVLSLALSERLAYSVLRERFSRFVSLAAALFLPLMLAVDWGEGNMTEEYILPLLFACYRAMLRWCRGTERGEYTHAPLDAALYGLCFSFALLTRLTNALGVCVGTAFITITLAVRGQWKNLFQNAGSFLGGALVLPAAFSAYFAAHGALYDMWYGTLLFNLDYLEMSDMYGMYGLLGALVLARRYLAGWCLTGAALWALVMNRGKKLSAFFWLCTAGVNTLFMYTLNSYAHYAIVLLPFLYIAPALVCPESGKSRRAMLNAAAALCIAAISVFSAGIKIYTSVSGGLPPKDEEYYGDDYTALAALIPENERDSFVAFDCPRRLYLNTGLRPSFRFFTLQQWMVVNSPSVSETLREEFAASDVKLVMTMNIYSVPLVTTDIIEENYTLVAQSEHGIYKLYRLN